ncbi:MAG: Uncharacterized protein Athens071424_190 [Parcubacteria group bacterium Athens0714_24]|nr:MAG: Uncharacterized protein Athens071424_190 [Parcubacteria group bacterium Athens0714_24]
MSPVKKYFIVSAVFIVFGIGAFLKIPQLNYFYLSEKTEGQVKKEEVYKPVHLKTPEPVRGIYMTSYVAGTKDWREKLANLIDTTELNAVVIDIKDYTGRISYAPDDPVLKAIGSAQNRIPDIKNFINYLHSKNIYVIGRISVFQDSYFVKLHPELAVKNKAGTAVWKDKKGISWLSACSKEVWDYTVSISKDAEYQGFDELNFDYIRFPSDGNMKDISYPFCGTTVNKSEAMENFFAYLSAELNAINIPISADLFGMTTTNTDDLNIGQVLEKTEPYFDYICPMVYPSHYPATYNGYKNPADHPYEIIKLAMDTASQRLLAASSTPSKLRPWLQDFDLGATYTAEMIRKEKQAVYDAGLTSWLLWDPANKYTPAALDK